MILVLHVVPGTLLRFLTLLCLVFSAPGAGLGTCIPYPVPERFLYSRRYVDTPHLFRTRGWRYPVRAQL